MATLNKEYFDFSKTITLSNGKIESLIKSRKALRDKIRKYFAEEKPDELQPKFHPQGSTQMRTTVNPIVETDEGGNSIYKYDLDYGIYFIEKEGENNKRSINALHDWVYNAVEDHTSTSPIRKKTCIRVVFSDGHHIDLPIYYKLKEDIELAHKSKGWITSDPKAFYEWFNNFAKGKEQVRRIVKYMKAWKNFKEVNNSNLKLPSGFELTILVVNNYKEIDNDDEAFRETIRAMKKSLDANFQCLRPTTPIGEDVFEGYSNTRKTNFLNALESLVSSCDKANECSNFKSASEEMRKQFGDRFPLGKDESVEDKSSRYSQLIGTPIAPKPYCYG